MLRPATREIPRVIPIAEEAIRGQTAHDMYLTNSTLPKVILKNQGLFWDEVPEQKQWRKIAFKLITIWNVKISSTVETPNLF